MLNSIEKSLPKNFADHFTIDNLCYCPLLAEKNLADEVLTHQKLRIIKGHDNP